MLGLRIVPALLLIACGGGPPKEANSAAEPADVSTAASAAPRSKGAQCLADASASRTASGVRPTSIDAKHILVRHAELKDPRGATRTREAACLRALEALEALQGGTEWDETVEKYSDAAGATKGALGTIEPDEVRKPFADAAFALQTNQLSYVVETDAGFHIILRTK